MYLPSAVTKQAEIDAGIQSVQESIGGAVVRIRYEIGEDWNGQWAIFFRIVLTDDAARHRLREVAAKVFRGLARHLDFPSMNCVPVPQLQERVGTSRAAGTRVGLADELLEDAYFLAAKGVSDNRPTLMRRAISTAYYAGFHLFVEDFVEHWEFEDQRARLGRVFNHGPMRNAPYTPEDKKNPTAVEQELIDAINAFEQLQKDRQRADYDGGWRLVVEIRCGSQKTFS